MSLLQDLQDCKKFWMVSVFESVRHSAVFWLKIPYMMLSHSLDVTKFYKLFKKLYKLPNEASYQYSLNAVFYLGW